MNLLVWVQITEGDIAEGEIGACTRCPIALAIKRAINPGCSVEVHDEGVTFDSAVTLPQAPWVSEFITSFDRLGDAEPTSGFILAPPGVVP